jgi:hypothetical protein
MPDKPARCNANLRAGSALDYWITGLLGCGIRALVPVRMGEHSTFNIQSSTSKETWGISKRPTA